MSSCPIPTGASSRRRSARRVPDCASSTCPVIPTARSPATACWSRASRISPNPSPPTRSPARSKASAIVALLRSGGQRGREQALAALRRITLDTATNARLELRDFSGRVLLSTGRFALGDSVLVSPGADSARFGPLIRRDTVLFFGVAAATPGTEQSSGGATEQAGGIVQQIGRLQLRSEE